MARLFVPAAVASVIVVAACGSSNSGKSSKVECNPATNPQFLNLQGIRVPGGAPSTPGNTNTPGTPTAPNTGADTAANECEPTQPGNLGNTPNTPNVPSQPGLPNTGTPRGPALNVGNINGRWELNSDFCEDGTQSPGMQRVFQMMLSGDFNQSLTISDTSIDEFSWSRFEIDADTNNTMMCTLMRKSSLTRGATGFRISRPSARFTDAGGLTPCNLQPLAAETIENVRLTAQGGSLIVELPKSQECNGKSRVQLYSGQILN